MGSRWDLQGSRGFDFGVNAGSGVEGRFRFRALP